MDFPPKTCSVHRSENFPTDMHRMDQCELRRYLLVSQAAHSSSIFIDLSNPRYGIPLSQCPNGLWSPCAGPNLDVVAESNSPDLLSLCCHSNDLPPDFEATPRLCDVF